jgi:iron complex outermembrane receptor protein
MVQWKLQPIAAGMALFLVPYLVFAQAASTADESTAAAPALEEITITAQRRSESLEHAALAISAISADQLNNSGATQVQQLTYLVPALQVATAAGPYPCSMSAVSATSTAIRCRMPPWH